MKIITFRKKKYKKQSLGFLPTVLTQMGLNPFETKKLVFKKVPQLTLKSEKLDAARR